jgi:hypothetical protein
MASHKPMYMQAHNHTIYNGQPSLSLTDTGQRALHAYNGILLSHKKE